MQSSDATEIEAEGKEEEVLDPNVSAMNGKLNGTKKIVESNVTVEKETAEVAKSNVKLVNDFVIVTEDPIQPNIAKDSKTSSVRVETKDEDEPVIILGSAASTQPQDNPEVKEEEISAAEKGCANATSNVYMSVSETFDIPHWETAEVPTRRANRLGKAQRKRLRYRRSERLRGSPKSDSDDDRPYRPSDIVKGEDDLSDVDYIGQNRKRHRRRVAATVLKTRNLTSDRQLVSHASELARYKLKNYSCFLAVPPADRDMVKFKPYHGSLFRNSIRNRRTKRRHVKPAKERSDGESSPSAGGLRSDPDFFELSAEQSETMPTEHMGYEVLSPTEEMESSRKTIMSFGLRLRSVNERAKPVKKRRKKSQLLSDFCNMMKFNPNELFADIDERHQKAANNENGQDVVNVDEEEAKKDKTKKSDEESDDSDFSSDEDQTMLVFDKMKRDASEQFYRTTKKKKRHEPKSNPDPKPMDLAKNTPRRGSREQPRIVGPNGNGSEYLLKNPMVAQYMKKYNYAGRLGKHGQGISEYIQPWNVSWGAGLGAQARSSAFRLDSRGNPNSSQSAPQAEKNLGDIGQSDSASRKRKSVSQSPRRLSSGSDVTVENIVYMRDNGYRSLPPDNGRRALLIDFDTFFTNSQFRRIEAFTQVIRDSPEISSIQHPSAIKSEMFTTRGDLCDRECMELLLSKFNVPIASLGMFLERLDDAFEKCTPLTVDIQLVKKFRDYSSFARLGIIHYGTSRRMKRELGKCRLSDRLVPNAVINVRENDQAPYIRSFRELFLRIGVSASQSLVIVSDRHNNQNFVCSGVVAARVVGARSLVQIGSRHGKMPAQGRQNPFQATLAIADKFLRGPRVMLNFTLKQQFVIRRKHVLAQNPKDNLWHSAVELFRPKPTKDSMLQVYVRYDEDGELNWCNSDSIHRLDDMGYEKMKDNDFPALIDVSSVDTLETNRAKRRRRV